MIPALLFTLAAEPLGVVMRPATDRTGDVASFERPRVLAAASRYLEEAPQTVTASRSRRSAGGPHEFFSEGDYWWPDPKNADGPYVQRDGMTNPDNFLDHRRAVMRLSLEDAARGFDGGGGGPELLHPAARALDRADRRARRRRAAAATREGGFRGGRSQPARWWPQCECPSRCGMSAPPEIKF